MVDEKSESNITDSIKDCFEALTSGEWDNFALFSCFVDGEPSVAIVVINEGDDSDFQVRPLFVIPTPGMMITDHEGEEPGGGV